MPKPATNIRVIVSDISQAIDAMTQEVFEVNDDNGWFDKDRSMGDDVALLHSEVSELFEAYRDWGLDDMTDRVCDQPFHDPGSITHGSHVCKPQGVGSEAADILIRLLDTCRRSGIDLSEEYVRKMAYNRTRGYRHGNKHI